MDDSPHRPDPAKGWDQVVIDATELLNTELPSDRFVTPAFVDWLYRRNPLGPGVEGNRYDDGLLVAHYGLIPQEFRTPDGPVPGLFSLNAAIRSTAQKQGHFSTLGRELYQQAADRGLRIGTAVTNANSTPGAVKYLGWHQLGPMPVKLVGPLSRPATGCRHHEVTADYLASDQFAQVAIGLDDHPVRGVTNRYTLSYLRWRLAWPNCPYHVHITDDLVAVSVRAVQNRVPAAAILKLLPRVGRTGPLSAASLITSIVAFHRVAFGVYAGWNEHVTVRGVTPPRRFLPSPLNALVRGYAPDIDAPAVPSDSIELDTFEFLDMDAY